MEATGTQTKLRKFFLPWQDGEREAWLETMSARGFEAVFCEGSLWTFVRTEPRKTRWSVDRPSWPQDDSFDHEGYVALLAEANWSYVFAQANGRYYFKSPREANAVPVHTDPDALAERLRRVIPALFLFPAIVLAQLPSLARAYAADPQPVLIPVLAGAAVLFLAGMGVAIANAVSIVRRIKALKQGLSPHDGRTKPGESS